MRSLLLKNLSISQICAFFFANLLGFFLLVLAVQFYCDITPLFNDDKGILKSEYVVVTKSASLLSNLNDDGQTFDENEINDLKNQSFVAEIGEFEACNYTVTAAITIPGTNQQYGTEMFFESVPDEFVDIDKDEWKYEEGGEIPIVLPRNYLNLYNFGFAQTRGLPKITEGMIRMMPISIFVSDKRFRSETERMTAHIVGFSNRLNTILVPLSFMKQMNGKFSSDKKILPSRLIIKLSNPADKCIGEYFQSKRLLTENDNIESGKLSWLFQTIIVVVMFVGAIVCVLAFFMLMLSIYLIVQKNEDKLKTLLLLGYTENQVSAPYITLASALNVLVCAITLLCVFLVRKSYLSFISEIYPQIEGGTLLVTFGVVAIALAFIVFLNTMFIRKRIAKIL